MQLKRLPPTILPSSPGSAPSIGTIQIIPPHCAPKADKTPLSRPILRHSFCQIIVKLSLDSFRETSYLYIKR